MQQPAADWYPDPMGRFNHRYWDGSRWTEHVSTSGRVAVDPLSQEGAPQASAVAAAAQTADAAQGSRRESAEAPAARTLLPPEASERVGSLNAKRIAQRLQLAIHEVARSEELARHELAELAGLEAVEIAERQRRAQEEVARLGQEVAARSAELNQLQSQLIVNRERLALEEFGLFDFEHPAESSTALSTELEALRSTIREAVRTGQAISAVTNFSFNDSAAKGQTFVNQMSKIMLRAYNAEAENAIKTVKAGNLASAQKRLTAAREQIARQGSLIELRVTDYYHYLRLKELEVAARHLQAVAAAKELERERRAELREQRKLEAEIQKEKDRLEKERSHYLNSIERLRAAGDDTAADELQAELDRIDDEIAEADYRAANIRAGYVYVVSNIGAFGEGVVKIGMTRRLEPMDRINELGDASVPFRFDVHALFFSEDAVSIEAMLHRTFAEQRLNKVNHRREFFRATPDEVLEALAEHKVSLLEFTTKAAAEDFRMSWPSGYPTMSTGDQ